MKSNINFISLLPILLMLGITVYFTIIVFKFPFTGVVVKEQNNQWIVERVDENGWASNQLINEGDVLEFVNGNQPEYHSPVKWFNRAEMVDSITILNKNMETKTFSIPYNNIDSQYATYFTFPFILSILILIFSIFLYWKNREGKSVTILLYFLLTVGVLYLSSFISVRGDIIGWGLNTITLSGSLILFMHFIKNYLLRYNLIFISNKLLSLLYVLNFIVLPVIVACMIFLQLNMYAKIFELSILFLLTCYVLFLLTRFYVKYRNSNARGFLKILLLTLVIAFGPAILFYVIPNIFFKKELLSPEITLAFLIIIPIVFIYLQMTEKLFDIEFVLNRLGYYTLLSFPFAFIIACLLSFILNFALLSGLSFITFSILITSMIFSLYIKEFLDYRMRHHLFSQKYNFENSLFAFFQKSKHETQVNSLITNLMNELKDVLGIKKNQHIELIREGKNWNLKNRDQLSSLVVADLNKIEWDQYQIGALIEFVNGFVIIIGEDHNYRNIIYCSSKSSKTNLNIQEKIWLETLAYYSSILLENFQLIEDLFDRLKDYSEEKVVGNGTYPNWLSKLFLALSEKERMNLSIDLHDSVLQEQLQLLRNIEKINDKVEDESLKMDLLYMKEKVLDNIYLVRETCNELLPPFLNEVGVIQSIQILIDRVNLRSDFILKTELDASIHRLSNELELILYRVVQELLNNAMKHSEASVVKLSLSQRNNILSLIYNDDGVGIEKKKLDSSSIQTIGIFGIKERIKTVGGTIEFDSAVGKGMQVSIEVRS